MESCVICTFANTNKKKWMQKFWTEQKLYRSSILNYWTQPPTLRKTFIVWLHNLAMTVYSKGFLLCGMLGHSLRWMRREIESECVCLRVCTVPTGSLRPWQRGGWGDFSGTGSYQLLESRYLMCRDCPQRAKRGLSLLKILIHLFKILFISKGWHAWTSKLLLRTNVCYILH